MNASKPLTCKKTRAAQKVTFTTATLVDATFMRVTPSVGKTWYNNTQRYSSFINDKN